MSLIKSSLVKRCIAFFVNVAFIFSSFLVNPTYIHAAPAPMPAPGAYVALSSSLNPLMLKGVKVHPQNPILFDFILDLGESKLSATDAALKTEADQLIKYFLAALAIPDTDMWVNLSPYERSRVIPESLSQTDMGRDMLAQDYLLKQISASLIHPDKELGKKFWSKVYAQAGIKADAKIDMTTFNKVWILADSAKIFVRDNTAYVVDCHLKVMMEDDYIAHKRNELEDRSWKQKQNNNSSIQHPASSISNNIYKEMILPAIEREVNQGAQFSNLRQMYHAMILAAWYKKNLKDALLNQVYSNKAKVGGIDIEDKEQAQKIYTQYVQAYRKGVFNLIKEEDVAGQIVPRKYFSGGIVPGAVIADPDRATLAEFRLAVQGASLVGVAAKTSKTIPADAAMVGETLIAYNNDELSQSVKQIVEGYKREGVSLKETILSQIVEAGDFLKTQFKGKVVIIETENQSFQIARLDENGQEMIYIEKSFYEAAMVRNSHALTQAFIYTLIEGTHAQKKVKEAEYLIKTIGKAKLAQDLKTDFVKLYENLSQQLRKTERDEQMAREIDRRIKELIYEMLVQRFNGETRDGRIRMSYGDAKLTDSTEDSGDMNVVYFGLAANPLHFGQIETLLRAMVQSKASKGIFRVHGFDFRKAITGATLDARHEMVKLFVEAFGQNVLGYTDIGKENDLDAEADFINFIKLNAGRKNGKLTVSYLVGSDHMHYYAPDYKGPKGPNQQILAFIKDGVKRPDTLQKFERFAKDNGDFLKANNVEFVVLFNERDPKESQPIQEEMADLDKLKQQGLYRYILLRELNLEGASSTAIREALAGVGDLDALTILPALIEDYIRNNAKYRGFIIELPGAIRSFYDNSKDEKSKNLILNWMREEQRQGRSVSVERIVNMFSLPDALLVVDDVGHVLDKLQGLDNPMTIPQLKEMNGFADPVGKLLKKGFTSEQILAVYKNTPSNEEFLNSIANIPETKNPSWKVKQVVDYSWAERFLNSFPIFNPLTWENKESSVFEKWVRVSIEERQEWVRIFSNVPNVKDNQKIDNVFGKALRAFEDFNSAVSRETMITYVIQYGLAWVTIADMFTDIIKENPQQALPAINAMFDAWREGKMDIIIEREIRLFEDDHAMTMPASSADLALIAKGGIDLGAQNLNMDVNGNVNIQFDPAMVAEFKKGDFSGVSPVIINITPINSIWPLFGMSEPVANQQMAVAI